MRIKINDKTKKLGIENYEQNNFRFRAKISAKSIGVNEYKQH